MSAPRYEHGAMGTGSNREPADLGNLSNAENDELRGKIQQMCVSSARKESDSDRFLAACAEISVIADCGDKREAKNTPERGAKVWIRFPAALSPIPLN